MFHLAYSSLVKNGLVLILISYVSASVVLGGAGREGHYYHGVLQGIAGIGLAGLIATWPTAMRLESARVPIGLLTGFVVLGVVQSIPLPAELWESLPGRGFIKDGFYNLAISPPSIPISLDVDETLTTICYASTPLFVIALCIRIGAKQLSSIVPWFFCLIGVASVFLGILQVIEGPDSVLYYYEFSNNQYPIGFFSNINHQATLLLIVLPYAFFLLNAIRNGRNREDSGIAKTLIVICLMFVILVGIIAAGSMAGYAIFIPIMALVLWVSRRSWKTDTPLISRVFPLIIVVLGSLLVASSPILADLGITPISTGELSRIGIWRITIDALHEHWLLGIGIGTYESVIPHYEDPDVVMPTFIAKAHNDVLQVFLEGGLVGIALLVFAIAWFFRSCFQVWGRQSSGTFRTLKKFAAISILVVVLHSLVDYPARTPAIAAMLSVSVAIIVFQNSRRLSPERGEQLGSENEKRLVL